MKEISLRTFSHQENLKILDLSNNNLSKIIFDKFLPHFDQLTELHLNNNKLKSLDGWQHTIFPRLNIFLISMNDFTVKSLRVPIWTIFDKTFRKIFR